MCVRVVVVLQFPAYVFFERTCGRILMPVKFLEKGIDPRKPVLLIGLQSDIELFNRIFSRLLADNNVKILALANRTVVHLLRADIEHLIRERLTDHHLKKNPSIVIDIVQHLEKGH